MKSTSQKFLSLRVLSCDGNSTVFTASLATLSLGLILKWSLSFKGLETHKCVLSQTPEGGNCLLTD